ncbi:hypothetical protein EYF80_047740 [Liparis tanakae]|uniref:Uncharacterized protein n=1 Tax=Liparis tanakae TaxID=230148 RepID=A0A4Z2FME6_9TELE|nr:hypothetical protein EYF80_047740 [Liparis tanakae]
MSVEEGLIRTKGTQNHCRDKRHNTKALKNSTEKMLAVKMEAAASKPESVDDIAAAAIDPMPTMET